MIIVLKKQIRRIRIITFHENMNEWGGELAKESGFGGDRLPASHPRMMHLARSDTQSATDNSQVSYKVP
jgi:hypothetical protein